MRWVCVRAAALIVAATPVPAAADWLSLRSEHLQVVGNVSAGELRDVALRLEQFREVVATLNQATVQASEGVSVVVLVFRDNRSYQPFMPQVDGRRVPVNGMFVGGGLAGTYITLNLDAGREAYPAIYHEYSHFLLRGVFGGAPLWFNEGLAEYYSTLDITSDGRRALIGTPIERHVELLRKRRLPLAQLLSITAASPVYTRDTPDRAVLYAQSWAVVHHALHGEPRRRDQLVNMAFKLATGAKPDQAVREAYGMTPAGLEREVQAYMRREVYQATSFQFRDALVTSVSADVTPADEAQVDAWLGSVQASIGRVDDAAVRLEKALKARPDLGAAHAALASVRLRQGRTADANLHLEAARKLDGMPRPAFQVQLRGREARELIVPMLLKAGDYARVRAVLTPVVKADPRDHDAALGLAEALLHLDDLDGARALLGPVLANATTQAQRTQARALLSELAGLRSRRPDTPAADVRTSETKSADSAPASAGRRDSASRVRLVLRELKDGEQRTYGTLQAIECRGDGIVIVVRTAQGQVRASAASFGAVDFVTYRSIAPGSISCGAQPESPAFLTWRPDGARSLAVALELVPDGLVP